MHRHVLRMGKRIGIAIAGGFVMLLGLVLSMPLVPGPGLAVMVLGLAILSLEFERPRLWLEYLRGRWLQLKDRLVAGWHRWQHRRAARRRSRP